MFGRPGAGRHVVLADIRLEAAESAAKLLEDAGFETSAFAADLSSRDSLLALIDHARSFGPIANVINAAGVYADKIHAMVSKVPMSITARRGEYCLCDKSIAGWPQNEEEELMRFPEILKTFIKMP